MKKKLNERKVSRIILYTAIAAAAVFVLSLILYAVLENRESDKIWKHRDEREKAYLNIVNSLEYNGLDDAARALMNSFAQTYTAYSNFVVMDSDFTILHATNKGFIDENSSKFYVLASVENYMALICDADGNVISSHNLDGNSRDALRRLTETYPAKSNASRIPDVNNSNENNGIAYSNIGNAYVIYSESTGYDLSESTLRFNAIKSKNLYISFLYNESDALWSGNQDDWSGGSAARTRETTLILMMVLSFMLYWLALPVFVFLDARRHDNHPALWGVLTLFTNAVGLIVYLVVRPERIYCSGCREPLEQNHAYCPFCGVRNQAKCANCGNLVKSDWANCPGCGASLAEAIAVIGDGEKMEN